MADNNKHFIIGTAGHIDHGKSSLVLALTGSDPDRLKQEKERGITISLGFADIDLGQGIHAGMVDVPGHEKFVREMIAGATGVDIALLCIAADDGIMPQTKEHLNVIQLLGIPTLVVTITKCDMVDSEWIEAIKEEIQEFLKDTPYSQAYIVPCSSKTGEGIEDLRTSLREATMHTSRHIFGNIARQPVDRSFTIRGAGTVVTGTLWSGEIKINDELEILPSRKITRVRSIQIHDKSQNSASAGNRVALNLNGVSTSDVKPGDMLVTPNSILPSDTFNAEFTYIGGLNAKKPFKGGSEIHLSHGTKEICARILLTNGKKILNTGETDIVQIRCEEKLPINWRDRFIVRSYSPVEVIGGGIVLMSHPRRNTNLKDSEIELLNALQGTDEHNIVCLAFNQQTLPVSPKQLAIFTGLPQNSIKMTLNNLVNKKEAYLLDKQHELYTTKKIENSCCNTVISALKRFHSNNRDATGISKENLKNLCFNNVDDNVFDAIINSCIKNGELIVSNGEISHISAGIGAKKSLDDASRKVLKTIKEAGATPPYLRDIAGKSKLDTKICSKAITALEKNGDIVRVGKDFYFDKDTIHDIIEKTKEAIKSGKGSVAELKDALNTSRKYAVPILEYMDKLGITERKDDIRILKKQ